MLIASKLELDFLGALYKWKIVEESYDSCGSGKKWRSKSRAAIERSTGSCYDEDGELPELFTIVPDQWGLVKTHMTPSLGSLEIVCIFEFPASERVSILCDTSLKSLEAGIQFKLN